MTGTVCTLFEITNGDMSTDQEFHELDAGVLLKAIKLLEQAGKCEHISFDDNEGVKFFWRYGASRIDANSFLDSFR